MKGSRQRAPSAPGASSIAQVPANRQSMPAEAHSCPTDSSESLMVGTQRTPERVSSTLFPLSSRAETHMSPMATQR
eukprot:5629620-Pleurochrysis_carterae.AAC.1